MQQAAKESFRAVEKRLPARLEPFAIDDHVDVGPLTFVDVGIFHDQRRLVGARQNALYGLAANHELPPAHGVALNFEATFAIDRSRHGVGKGFVKIVAAELRIAKAGHWREHQAVLLDQRGVEGAAAEVANCDGVSPIHRAGRVRGRRQGSGIDLQKLEMGEASCAAQCAYVGTRGGGGHRNDGAGCAAAKALLGNAANASEDGRCDLLAGVVVAANVENCEVARSGLESVADAGIEEANFAVLEGPTEETFDPWTVLAGLTGSRESASWPMRSCPDAGT